MSSIIALGTMCLLLTGCAGGALLGRAALAGVGPRVALAEMGAARMAAGGAAAGLSEGAVAGSLGRLSISPRVIALADGNLGRALAELSAGRASLTIHPGGVISAGSEGVALFNGSELVVGSRVIGFLQRGGTLVSADTGTAVGRLRGMIPQRGAAIEISGSGATTSVRSMMVDILELSGGRYHVLLASGETAWVPVSMVVLALLAADEEEGCRPEAGGGVLVRTSGEAVPFDSCELGDDVVIVWSGGEGVVIAGTEVAKVLHESSAVELASLAERPANLGS